MGLIWKRNKWYIRFRYGGKDVWRAVGPSKRKAELYLGKIKAEIAEGKFLDPLKGNQVTYGELLDRYLKEYSAVYKRPNSYRNNIHEAKYLRPRFGGLLLKDVTHAAASRMVKELLDSKLRSSTANRVVALLKHTFTKAKEWGLMRYSPVADVKKLPERNERTRCLSREEYRCLLEVAPWYLKPIIITAVNTGMRKGEVLSLKWDQVNLGRRTITLRDTKNGKPRPVPLNSTMVDLLRDLMRERARRGSSSPYVFVNPLNGDRWWKIDNGFRAAVKRAGIEDFRFHDLRHTAATWLREAGADLLILKEFLGHKTLAMVQRYTHVSSGDVLKAAEALCAASKPVEAVQDAGEL